MESKVKESVNRGFGELIECLNTAFNGMIQTAVMKAETLEKIIKVELELMKDGSHSSNSSLNSYQISVDNTDKSRPQSFLSVVSGDDVMKMNLNNIGNNIFS